MSKNEHKAIEFSFEIILFSTFSRNEDIYRIIQSCQSANPIL